MDSKDSTRFYCPFEGCVYGAIGDKHFKKKMFLNHHIANVHSEKKYSCSRCAKKYAMEWQLRYHLKSCGVQWSCVTCEKTYTERLSLVTHCKRHSHQLPPNAIIKTSKASSQSQINVHLIVMPVVVDVSPSQTSSRSLQRQILPKLNDCDDSAEPEDRFARTAALDECHNCRKRSVSVKSESSVESPVKSLRKAKCVSTQTDKCSQRTPKARESRMCQTITKRNRKPACVCESIETQTLESALHSNAFDDRCLKISASTSTSPPKRPRKRSFATLTSHREQMSKKLCAFTQTSGKHCDSETSTDDINDLLLNSANPLIGQMSTSTNAAILEQSVQTESEFVFEFNDSHTQTVNIDLTSNNNSNNTDILDFNDEFLFSDFSEFTDIETQTIWNNDRTTQTDEHLDEFDEVIKKILENSCQVSDQIFFADTETQTQVELN